MTARAQSREQRAVIAAARRYRREGYRVNEPDGWPGKPAFLGDLTPDLIAEREDDRVVIEVKRATAVRGANEIVELAERVTSQPGWRFELIAVPSTAYAARPDLRGGSEDVRRLLDRGFPKPAFVLVCAMIENLASYAVAQQDRNPANMSFPRIVRDLVALGIVDEDTMHMIDHAVVRRNAILHRAGEPLPTSDDVEALLKLGHLMEQDILAAGSA